MQQGLSVVHEAGMYTCTGMPCRAGDGTEQGRVDAGRRLESLGCEAMPRQRSPSEARNEIDRLRAELRGDFRSALRHAYLGPRCRHSCTRLWSFCSSCCC